MMSDKEKALDGLAKLQQQFEKTRIAHEAKVDEWWDSITTEEREMAFYSICKRIYKAELQDGGTYRWALYDVFGFDGGMYRHGMNCGYMAIHNAIFDGEELQRMKSVTRFEVIDDTGRAYVKYRNKDEKIKYCLQDDDHTLKVFIGKRDEGQDNE